jgi:hypothetical protein
MSTARFDRGFDPYVHRALGEVAEDILDRIRTLCMALPEVTTRVDECNDPERSSAWSFDIRRRSFCLLVHSEDPTGESATVLVLRAAAIERQGLLAIGHPFFEPLVGPDRVGVEITDDADWSEIGELVTDSYRTLAPKKLIAMLSSLPINPG